MGITLRVIVVRAENLRHPQIPSNTINARVDFRIVGTSTPSVKGATDTRSSTDNPEWGKVVEIPLSLASYHRDSQTVVATISHVTAGGKQSSNIGMAEGTWKLKDLRNTSKKMEVAGLNQEQSGKSNGTLFLQFSVTDGRGRDLDNPYNLSRLQELLGKISVAQNATSSEIAECEDIIDLFSSTKYYALLESLLRFSKFPEHEKRIEILRRVSLIIPYLDFSLFPEAPILVNCVDALVLSMNAIYEFVLLRNDEYLSNEQIAHLSPGLLENFERAYDWFWKVMGILQWTPRLPLNQLITQTSEIISLDHQLEDVLKLLSFNPPAPRTLIYGGQGVGKTTLMRTLLMHPSLLPYRGYQYYVDCNGISLSLKSLVLKVISTMSFISPSNCGMPELGGFIRARGIPILLIMDNCHGIDGDTMQSLLGKLAEVANLAIVIVTRNITGVAHAFDLGWSKLELKGLSIPFAVFRSEVIPLLVGSVEPVDDGPADLSKYLHVDRSNSVLGGGGFGDVYKGTWTGLPNFLLSLPAVAVKMLRSSTLDKKCLREIHVWRGLDHMNVVPFIGTMNIGGGKTPSLISLFMPNGDLKSYLRQHPETRRALLVKGVAAGLAYLHDRTPSITHGDVKPANILVDSDGTPRLCDFGLSRLASEDSLWRSSESRGRGGTERYMAPELLVKAERVSCASDVWAFAATASEVMTDKPPYSEHNAHQIIAIFLGPNPVKPAASCRWLSDRFWSLLESCWEMKPEDRPSMGNICLKLNQCEDRI